jgi:hypothetical protein
MEKIIKKLENTVNTYIDEIKENPIKTTIKTIVVIYILKYLKEYLTND